MNKDFKEWWKINENEISMSLDGENFYAESWTNNAKNLFKNCFESGQQSAKPKWIPVTERLPTAADGIKYNIDGEKNVGVIAKNIYGVRSFAFYSLDKKKWCDGLEYIEWQPLPEE